MPGPVAAINSVATAKGIKAQLGSRMLSPRNRDRVDHPVAAHRIHGAAGQFSIQKTEIETGVVRNQRCIAQKIDQLGSAGVKQRFIRQKGY